MGRPFSISTKKGLDSRHLIHPYSDSAQCSASVPCLKLEELLAIKLKCLLQRRHSFDLYDYVHAIFINNELAVNRSEIVRTFLKRTIFEPSPGVVTNLLLGLPFEFFRAAWNKYIVCPKISRVDFDTALTQFIANIQDLFGALPVGYGALAYFPANLRNPIVDAGSNLTLLSVTYDGIKRVVEPYSLVFKRRKDGHGQEYLYVYDRTGGRESRPGIKSFLHPRIQALELLDEHFEPRFPVELSKAGEYGDKTYFAKPFSEGRTSSGRSRPQRSRVLGIGITYVVECTYCGRRFRRSTFSSRLRDHKDKYGNRCFGRVGYLVGQI